MIDAIDTFIAWPFQTLLRLLCSTTGRSNFFFARLASVAFVMGAAATTFWSGEISWGILTGLWVLQAIYYFLHFAKAEHEAQSYSEFVPTGLISAAALQFSRLNCMLIGTLMVAPTLLYDHSLIGAVIGWYSQAAAIYFAVDITPKSKSWLRRGVDWLMAHTPSFSPAPAPRPEIA